MFKHLLQNNDYTHNDHLVPKFLDWEAKGTLANFQDETSGLLYIPDKCNKKSVNCKLHVAFNNQPGSDIRRFATDTGYLQYAASNNIIMLFPEIIFEDNEKA